MNSSVIILNSIIIFISLVIWAIIPSYYNETIMCITLCMSILSVFSYIVTIKNDKNMRGQYLRTSYVFFIGFLIVFFQKNIDLLLHYINKNNEVFASDTVICSCALFSLIGLSSFVIGSSIAVSKIKPYRKVTNNSVPIRFISFQKLLFIFFVALYVYYNLSSILSGSFIYNEEAMTESAGSLSNYSAVMIQVLIFTILSCNVLTLRNVGNKVTPLGFIRINGLMFLVPLIIYLSLVFMTGDRGPILTTVLAFTITYVIATQKKIKFVTLFLAVFIGGSVLSIIGTVRKSNNLLTVQEMLSYKNQGNEESIFPVTKELADSYNTFTYSVAKVPSQHDYFYGMMKLRDLGYSVPFLYRSIPFLYSKKEHENGSTSYCTYLIQGLNRTYGNGSSLLADIYLDFGLIGIIFIMMLLGFLIVYIDEILFYSTSPYWLVTSVACFSYSIYLSRATLTTPLYYIVPALIIIYSKKFFKK